VLATDTADSIFSENIDHVKPSGCDSADMIPAFNKYRFFAGSACRNGSRNSTWSCPVNQYIRPKKPIFRIFHKASFVFQTSRVNLYANLALIL
jgi:hypothetical protein